MMLLLPAQQPFSQLGHGSFPPSLQELASRARESNLLYSGSPILQSSSLPTTGQPNFTPAELQQLFADQHAGRFMHTSQPHMQQKRQLSDLNHNKAITKQLVSACHYQQVLDCVAQSVSIFDEVNVATALHRLARLQPPATNNRASFIIQTKEFQLLVRVVKFHLPRFEAQAISNTMWAFAALSFFPQDNLLSELANKAASIMPSFRPQAVSNTLWAFAKLGYLPPQALLQAVASQMLQDLPKSVPQDISNTLWAFATLRHHPGQELLSASSQQALTMFHKFKPQEIANLLWSFATMDYSPPGSLLDAMAVQMVARIQSFRPQAVSNSLWAYAKIGYNPGIMLLDVTALKAATMFHQYTSQEVANTLWALAALDHHPGHEMLNAAAIQFAKRLEHFTPQDIASTLWAFAKLSHTSCRGLLQSVAMHVLKLWARFTPTAVVTVLESLALLQGCPLRVWQQLLARFFQLPAASLTSDNLWHLYHTFLLLEAQAQSLGVASVRELFPEDVLEAAREVWLNRVKKNGWPDPLLEDISQHLWALGISHTNDEIVADGQMRVDSVVNGTNVVIMVETVNDFTASCRSKLGASAAKVMILEGMGYKVVTIPFYEWGQFTSSDIKITYLLQKLQTLQRQEIFHHQALQSFEAFGSTSSSSATMPSLHYSEPGQNMPQPFADMQHSVSQPGLLSMYRQQGLLQNPASQPQTQNPMTLSQQQPSMAQLSNALSSVPLQANTPSSHAQASIWGSAHGASDDATLQNFRHGSVASLDKAVNTAQAQKSQSPTGTASSPPSQSQSVNDLAAQFRELNTENT